MRTPLNVIISTINLLKLEIVNDQYEKDYFLEKMDYMINNSNRLLRSVNNYIDIARIDSNVIDISFTMENLVEVIDEVVDVTADYIKGSNVDENTKLPPVIMFHGTKDRTINPRVSVTVYE